MRTLAPGESEQAQAWCVRYRCTRCLKIGKTEPDFTGPAKSPGRCGLCKSPYWEVPRKAKERADSRTTEMTSEWAQATKGER